jgi:hypothetical protein
VGNPQQCALGSWAFSSTVGLPDGTVPVFASPVICSGS